MGGEREGERGIAERNSEGGRGMHRRRGIGGKLKEVQ